jgi:Cdc6-like AAA superfamily ATPase
MFLRSRGLLVDGPDRELYVERPSIERALLVPALRGGNVLLLGPSGSGKTTALRKLESDLRRGERAPHFVNGRLADSPSALLQLVAEQLQLSVGDDWPVIELLHKLDGVSPRALLVDGLGVSSGLELFSRYRDELWSLEHTWTLTSTPVAAAPLRVSHAGQFWDQTVSLPPFDQTEVDELLARGLDPDELARLYAAGWQAPDPAWPRAVVRSVFDVLEDNPLQAPDEIQELRAREADLERLPTMVLTELRGLRRPAAAGDTELLARLGYSRAYVARALTELEDLGLVVSTPENMEGKAGRPRKLYEAILADR